MRKAPCTKHISTISFNSFVNNFLKRMQAYLNILFQKALKRFKKYINRNVRKNLAPSANSNQPAHTRNLITVVRVKKLFILGHQNAPREDSDHTAHAQTDLNLHGVHMSVGVFRLCGQYYLDPFTFTFLSEM